MYVLSALNLVFSSFCWFCSDPSPRCVLPRDVKLVRSDGLPKRKKDTGFHGVIHYTCTSADKSVKQATCVSGTWSPEIECACMFLDLHTISSFYVEMINARY